MFNPSFASNYAIEDLLKIFNNDTYCYDVTPEQYEEIKKVIINAHGKVNSHNDFNKYITRPLNFKYQKGHIIKTYRILLKNKEITPDPNIELFMVKKAPRGHSGVNVVTIFTSGTQFGQTDNDGNKEDIEDTIKRGGCPKNCHYCPFEKDENGVPTQPRSYLSTEPGNMRATENKHHPVGQMFSRLYTLEQMGHLPLYPTTPSKIEMIISGGTFNFYPKKYIYWFATCMYYAANIYYEFRDSNTFRPMLTLEEEQKINETAHLRIIGLTIETRPDYLDTNDFDPKSNNRFEVLQLFREIGVTRVQIGIQHTNDAILKYVNRECTNLQNKMAIKFLKDNGFKVDIHLMLDLPGSSPSMDIDMIDEVLEDSFYEADQWKIYPTEVTPYSKISEWYKEGKYVPYAETDSNDLLRVIIHAKKKMMEMNKYWIRINRVIRDIPVESIEGGICAPNFRNTVETQMHKEGISCICMRCREVKLMEINPDDVVMMIRKYEASEGTEYFISYETKDMKTLIGFIRLRLNSSFENSMPELQNCAFIRELHVYGKHNGVGDLNTKGVQHRGYGKLLLEKAEEIAKQNSFKIISIISGVGVREYYAKKGYYLDSTFMKKNLSDDFNVHDNIKPYAVILPYVLIVILAFIFKFFL